MEMYIKNLLKIAKYKSVPLFGNKQQNEKNADSDKSGRYSNDFIYNRTGVIIHNSSLHTVLTLTIMHLIQMT